MNQHVIDHLKPTAQQIKQLNCYVALLEKWNRNINLIGSSTVGDIWQRHILDCSSLVPYITNPKLRIADFGSGAGLPGILLAILTNNPITLVESIGKKAAFLREATYQLKIDCTILHQRIESKLPEKPYDIVVARALADVNTLWQLGQGWLKTEGHFLLLKGQNYASELEQFAAKHPVASYEYFPHSFGPGAIIRITQA